MQIEYDPSRDALYHPELRATVFEFGRSYRPEQLAVEAARLAYIRAETSSSERLRLTESLAHAGFDAPTLFADSATGSEAFAAQRPGDGTTLFSFRGTQPDDVADLGTDLRANTVAWPESAGRVHAGFAAAARTLIPQMREWIDRNRPEPARLILTGHSLGAALATLVASIWPSAMLVTLGSPRVGDAQFAETLAKTDILRLVNCCDVVTEIPPPIGGYVHVRACAYITADGQRQSDPTDEFIAQDRLRARLDYVRQYAWRIGSVLVRDLADHAPINYVRALLTPPK
jgi:Lipase (class 3)